MEKQDSPNIPPAVGGNVYVNGKWEGTDKAVADIIKLYEAWKNARPTRADRRHTWYCPVCSKTEYYAGSKLTPRCVRHNIEMIRYREEEFIKKRSELAEQAIRNVSKIVPLFVKTIEIYTGGRGPHEWIFDDGYVTVKPDDPTSLTYEVGTIHSIRALLYYCDAPRYCEAAKFLLQEADRLGFPTVIEFYAPHFNNFDDTSFNARYDRNRNTFVVKL
jgi:hypothetical protein